MALQEPAPPVIQCRLRRLWPQSFLRLVFPHIEKAISSTSVGIGCVSPCGEADTPRPRAAASFRAWPGRADDCDEQGSGSCAQSSRWDRPKAAWIWEPAPHAHLAMEQRYAVVSRPCQARPGRLQSSRYGSMAVDFADGTGSRTDPSLVSPILGDRVALWKSAPLFEPPARGFSLELARADAAAPVPGRDTHPRRINDDSRPSPTSVRPSLARALDDPPPFCLFSQALGPQQETLPASGSFVSLLRSKQHIRPLPFSHECGSNSAGDWNESIFRFQRQVVLGNAAGR